MRRLIPYTMMIALILTFVGCGGDDGPSGPSGSAMGSVDVASSTTGDDMDPDGYTVIVDGDSVNAVDAIGSVNIAELQEGSYDVELTDVRTNCKVDSDNPQSVNIAAGDTESLSFDISCKAAIVNKIAYHSSSDGQIHLMDTDGSNSTLLTSGSSMKKYPAISPDGTRILFSKEPSGGNTYWQLTVVDADGSNEVELTSGNEVPTYASEAAWSPDGSKILFISDRDGQRQIYSMDADGSNQQKLTNGSGSVSISRSAYSADGSQFVFTSNRDTNNNLPDLFVADADGSNIQQVTGTNSDEMTNNASWSPDGSSIAYVRVNQSGDFSINTIEPDGSNDQQLTNSVSQYSFDSLSWSADGSTIAYGQYNTNNSSYDIYIIATDDSGAPDNLTNTSDAVRTPSVSLLQ